MRHLYLRSVSLVTIFLFLHACSVYTFKDVQVMRAEHTTPENIIVIHTGDNFVSRLTEVRISDTILSGKVSHYISENLPIQ